MGKYDFGVFAIKNFDLECDLDVSVLCEWECLY